MNQRILRTLLGVALAVCTLEPHPRGLQAKPSSPSSVFLTTPYVQPGEDPRAGGSMELLWQSTVAQGWSVRWRPVWPGLPDLLAGFQGLTLSPASLLLRSSEPDGSRASAPFAVRAEQTQDLVQAASGGDEPGGCDREVAVSAEPVRLHGVPPFFVCRARLEGLPSGALVAYQVQGPGATEGTLTSFSSVLRARRASNEGRQRFAVLGDCGAGSDGQARVAQQMAAWEPDYVLVTGDVAYPYGRLKDYRKRVFPYYNAPPGQQNGTSLMARVPFLVAPGNHDIGFGHLRSTRDLTAAADSLAYFYVFSHPLNGPWFPGETRNTPALRGSQRAQQAFLQAAGSRYPRMANYSFDDGTVHWLILDANDHVDWSDPTWRRWVQADLAAAQGARWRLVGLHQAPFHSASTAAGEQRMRLLADLFEQGHVDIVFAGHVHDYERSYPLRFVAQRDRAGRVRLRHGRLDGDLHLDRNYDGRKQQQADGVIYIVSGAGGARLHTRSLSGQPTRWKPYTAHLEGSTHSYTQVEIENDRLHLQQVADDGRVLDEIRLRHKVGEEAGE